MGAWRDDVSHDQRYDLATEWLHVVKSLWSEPSVNFEGRYFQMRDCQSDPKPVSKPRPFLICAGTSGRGMQFTVAEADAIFCGGKDDAELAKMSRQAKAMARDAGRAIRTYTMMNLVIAATDAAAEAMAAHYRAGFDEGALRGMMRAYGFLDAQIGKENSFVANARSSFMAARLVGSAETVGRRLSELLMEGALDGVMLIFPEYLEGLRIFAERIQPGLRQLRSALV